MPVAENQTAGERLTPTGSADSSLNQETQMNRLFAAGMLAAAGMSLAAGLASAQTPTYVGKTIEQVQKTYGEPANMMTMPDGRRAYQFRPASVRDKIPNHPISDSSHGAVSTFSNIGTTDCLITMIAADHGQGFVIEETKMPRQGACA